MCLCVVRIRIWTKAAQRSIKTHIYTRIYVFSLIDIGISEHVFASFISARIRTHSFCTDSWTTLRTLNIKWVLIFHFRFAFLIHALPENRLELYTCESFVVIDICCGQVFVWIFCSIETTQSSISKTNRSRLNEANEKIKWTVANGNGNLTFFRPNLETLNKNKFFSFRSLFLFHFVSLFILLMPYGLIFLCCSICYCFFVRCCCFCSLIFPSNCLDCVIFAALRVYNNHKKYERTEMNWSRVKGTRTIFLFLSLSPSLSLSLVRSFFGSTIRINKINCCFVFCRWIIKNHELGIILYFMEKLQCYAAVAAAIYLR